MSASAPPSGLGISARKLRKPFPRFRRRNTIGTAGSAKRPASHCRALIRKSSRHGRLVEVPWEKARDLTTNGRAPDAESFLDFDKEVCGILDEIKRGKIPLSPVTVSPVACQMCGRAGLLPFLGGQTGLTDKQDQSQRRHAKCKSPIHHNETPSRLFMVFLGKKHSHPSVD